MYKNIFAGLLRNKSPIARSVSFGRGQAFPLKEFKYHKIDEGAIPNTATLTKADALKFFKQMIGVRLLENESGRLYMEKAIKGFCHLYSGQEACCVGMEAAIRRDDSVITAYRCHGWAYVRGSSIEEILLRADRTSDRMFQRKGRLDAYIRA